MIINWEKLQEVPNKTIGLSVGSYNTRTINVLLKVGEIGLSTRFKLCLVKIN